MRVVFFVVVILCTSIRGAESFQKGMSYLNWGDPTIDSPQSVQSLKNLQSTGTEWIALVVTWYQNTTNSTVIAPYSFTYTDESLSNFLGIAASMGFKVLLKPHVDCLDGTWRAWIGSTFNDAQWNEWFKSYNEYILKYAAIAQKFNLPLFSIGTEMIAASANEAQFRSLIANVRKVFAGNVTYAANWGSQYQVNSQPDVAYPINGEVDNIKWLDALNIIGVDAYYYLTEEMNPSAKDLSDGWAPIVEHLADLAATNKKQIIFTEVGYRSIEGSAIHPGWWNTTVPVNVTQQAACYEAVFSAFEGQTWWEGVYWWMWFTDPNTGGALDTGFSPQNKPAQAVLTQHYSESGI